MLPGIAPGHAVYQTAQVNYTVQHL